MLSCPARKKGTKTAEIFRIHSLVVNFIFFRITSWYKKNGRSESFINFNSQILSIFVSLPLLIFYNAQAKNYPLVGNVIVALILGLSFIYAGIVFENITPLIVPALLAFGLTLVREIVKDIADLEGDKVVGARTLPIIFGNEKAVYLCTFLSAILGCSAFILFLNGSYNFHKSV